MTLARGLRRQLDRAKQRHAEAYERTRAIEQRYAESRFIRAHGAPITGDNRAADEYASDELERAELNVIALKERLIDVLGRGE
jgi:hypothetical protein